MKTFDAYAEWFKSCLTCSQCQDCSFICNGNINRQTGSDEETGLVVLPQAGFIDKTWFEMSENEAYRVLILGLNPKGGTKIYRQGGEPESGDVLLYGQYYPDIIKAVSPSSTLNEILPALKELVFGYRPLSNFAAQLKDIVGANSKNICLAYCNQVLCRTEPEAGMLSGTVEPAYRTCFNEHILPLICITEPDLVLVMGRNQEGTGWSQAYFDKFYHAAKQADNIPVKTKCLGIPQTSRPNNKTRALELIHNFLLPGNMTEIPTINLPIENPTTEKGINTPLSKTLTNDDDFWVAFKRDFPKVADYQQSKQYLIPTPLWDANGIHISFGKLKKEGAAVRFNMKKTCQGTIEEHERALHQLLKQRGIAFLPKSGKSQTAVYDCTAVIPAISMGVTSHRTKLYVWMSLCWEVFEEYRQKVYSS